MEGKETNLSTFPKCVKEEKLETFPSVITFLSQVLDFVEINRVLLFRANKKAGHGPAQVSYPQTAFGIPQQRISLSASQVHPQFVNGPVDNNLVCKTKRVVIVSNLPANHFMNDKSIFGYKSIVDSI